MQIKNVLFECITQTQHTCILLDIHNLSCQLTDHSILMIGKIVQSVLSCEVARSSLCFIVDRILIDVIFGEVCSIDHWILKRDLQVIAHICHAIVVITSRGYGTQQTIMKKIQEVFDDTKLQFIHSLCVQIPIDNPCINNLILHQVGLPIIRLRI